MTDRKRLRLISLVTLFFFGFSMFGAIAQQIPPTIYGNPQTNTVDLSFILRSNPEVMALQNNVRAIETALKQIDRTALPLYNRVVPTNMEAMTIAERVKAIVGNTKNILGQGMNSYKGLVSDWNAAHGITPDSTFENQLGVGLNKLGIQASELPMGGKADVVVGRLRAIITAIKDRLRSLIAVVRTKIAAVAQRVGLMKKSDDDGKVAKREEEGFSQYADAPESAQYADDFAGRLSKGVNEGTQAAKDSLKSSFSFTNLAITTTVAVGTNLAIDMIRGKKPSLQEAVKSVATLEFAGSVVGSALGAAGGQFTASLVRTFIPGPIGALVGAVVPVMFASAGGQMGLGMVSGARRGRFSVVEAWKRIDKIDLVGSSIGSTIGVALGAPIPIIGPIIGGIVGGIIGSRVANWVRGSVKGGRINIISRGNQLPPETGYNTGGISIGTIAGGDSGSQGLGIHTGGRTIGGLSPVGSQRQSPQLQTVKKQYYEAYLQYNRALETGNRAEAQKILGQLKTYQDQYNQLRKAQ